MNPFDELFDTQSAIAYLNQHGKKIARITLAKNYQHLGFLLNPRLRVYFKRELDAFIAGENYTPDPAYEQSVLTQLYDTDQASNYLDIHLDRLRHIMADKAITFHRLGRSTYFIQSWLDDYRKNTTTGRPSKDES